MKKRNFWAKCIAFLLVVVMVLSEQNITTLGETIGSYAQERMTGSSEQETERAIIKEDSSQESSSADGSSSSSSETSQAESSVSKNDSQKTQQTDNNSDAGSAQTDQGTSASSGQQALTDGASDVDNAGAQNEKKTAMTRKTIGRMLKKSRKRKQRSRMTDRPPVMRMVRIMAVITVKIPEIKVARRLKMLRKRTTGIMGPRRPQP